MPEKSSKQPMPHRWYEGAVVYQVYPRSFQDTTGNGVGDLQGVIDRLNYLNDGHGGGLGVDAIWLSPIYTSPMIDFGYDVADYCDIDPLFGSLDIFDNLIDQAHQRGIKVLVDFVPNHTSNKHPWFEQSRSAKTSDKRDWYVWRDGKPGGGPPNNWLSVFGGLAWQYDRHTGQYYLHSFLKEQPDLNWENPQVRHAIAEAMRFWLKRGVDGFRIDATDHIGKQANMDDEPRNPAYSATHDPYDVLEHIYSKNAGNYHKHMHFLASVLAHHPDKIAILETWMQGQRKTQLLLDFYEHMPKPNAMPFNFELMDTPWEAHAIKARIDTFQAGLTDDHLPVYVLSNHDRKRFPSRLGEKVCASAATLELTLPGIALVYYGDEIGMSDIDVKPEDTQDPFGKRHPEYSRDGCRSPMQWDNSVNSGFSDAQPWLPLHENYETTNVAAQLDDNGSLLTIYQRLIALRREKQALRIGRYVPVLAGEDGVLVFDRATDNDVVRIIINFTDKAKELLHSEARGEVLFSTHKRGSHNFQLQPHEAKIIKR